MCIHDSAGLSQQKGGYSSISLDCGMKNVEIEIEHASSQTPFAHQFEEQFEKEGSIENESQTLRICRFSKKTIVL